MNIMDVIGKKGMKSVFILENIDSENIKNLLNIVLLI
jgi:hypothetical protein